MVVIGLWVAIVGYGIAYAGVVTLGGAQCSFLDAFRGRCQAGATKTASAAPSSGTTVLGAQQAQQQQQAGMIGATPILQQA